MLGHLSLCLSWVWFVTVKDKVTETATETAVGSVDAAGTMVETAIEIAVVATAVELAEGTMARTAEAEADEALIEVDGRGRGSISPYSPLQSSSVLV